MSGGAGLWYRQLSVLHPWRPLSSGLLCQTSCCNQYDNPKKHLKLLKEKLPISKVVFLINLVTVPKRPLSLDCDGSTSAWSCCSANSKCGHGEGDCDSDQGWKFMSCSHCQELGQKASWLLICCTRVNIGTTNQKPVQQVDQTLDKDYNS